MKTSDFYYDLPKELIAQTPLERRDASRLMTLDRRTGETAHRRFYDLPELVRPGDCLILNDSRVLPARLLGQRLPGGGACEVLLLIDRGDRTWECLVRPGRKLRPGAQVSFGDGQLTGEITGETTGGNRLVRFNYQGIFLEVLEQLGKMPLPPYIKEELQDRERYQTVYSKVPGSAAAPSTTKSSALFMRCFMQNYSPLRFKRRSKIRISPPSASASSTAAAESRPRSSAENQLLKRCCKR